MATLDVIDVETAAEALQVPARRQNQLARLVTAVSARMDDEFGAIVTRTITGETHKTRGLEGVLLEFWPVTSVTAELSSTAITPVVDDEWGILFHPTRTYWPHTRRPNLTVNYTAGRFATTADVTEVWREAAIITIRHLWHAANPATSDPGEYEYVGPTFPRFVLPNAAVEMLRQYRRLTPVVA